MGFQRREWIQLAVCSSVCTGAAFWVAYRRWCVTREREKPQRRFRVVNANNSDAAFPHLVIKETDGEGYVALGSVEHPYSQLIEELKSECTIPLSEHEKSRAEDIDSLPWKWIDTNDQLADLVAVLQEKSQFSIDIEHHKHRSYRGFICLIQIFTGACTYLVDAIALHDELHALNKVFSNPYIQKVMHGCHNDVMWLQQDFRVYLVNVFDTEKACQVLNKPTRNLAFLLKHYFGQTSNKSLQVADWRHRPLTDAQLLYAVMDVKYLLSLKDALIEELVVQDNGTMYFSKSFLSTVELPSLHLTNAKSQDILLGMYQSVGSREATMAAATQLIRKHMTRENALEGFPISQLQFSKTGQIRRTEDIFRDAVFQLCSWRDRTARQEDESCEYILKSRILVAIALHVPQTAEALMAVATQTPIHELLPGEVDCQTDIKLWEPAKPFTSQVEKIAQLMEAAVLGTFVWIEGQTLLERPRHPKKLSPDEARAAREKHIESLTSKSKVYENCQMLGADGSLLCYCDRRRLEWYIKKGLARKVEDAPFTIQLLFQHRTTDEENGAHNFYVQSRQNRCVGCGEEGHFLRYKVVPSCYRRHFPVHMKSHRSHDVVLLCLDCHHEAQIAADQLKKVISKEYGIPLHMPRTALEAAAWSTGGYQPLEISSGNGSEQFRDTIPFSNIRGAAIALRRHGQKIPEARRKELEGIIHQFFGRNPASEDGLHLGDLDKAAKVGLARKHIQKSDTVDSQGASASSSKQSEDERYAQDGGHAWHGEKVVQQILLGDAESELYNLIRRFRIAFVEHVKPQFLPDNWTVDHCASRHFGQFSIFYQGEKKASSPK